MSGILQDARYAMRQLKKAPAFTLTAVLTLALSVGATLTMYSVVRSVLLAPLPYTDPDRLVGVAFTFPQEKPHNEEAGTGADFIAQHAKSFASTAVLDDGTYGTNLSIGNGSGAHALQIQSLRVSRSYFPTLGVRPMLGRDFTAEEDLPGGPKVALLSYGLWERVFNHDPNVVDRAVRINGESCTIVGVMPASTQGASESGRGRASTIGMWQPLQLGPKDPGYDGDNFQMIARLRAGVTLAQAQQEMDSFKKPFYQQFPGYISWTNKGKLLHEFRVWPLKDVVVSDARGSLLALAWAVIAVLLVGCLNLAGLMTARASQRAREIAIRSALGASRSGVLRLLMCESALLALTGCGLGLLLAREMIPALLASAPMPLPQMRGQMRGEAGGWVLIVAGLSVACATTAIFGLIPALGVIRQDATEALQSGRSIGASASQTRLGKALMVGQVAVAMVLLTSASLLLGSFLKLRLIPSGVEAKRLVVAQVNLKGNGYATTLRTTQFIRTVLAKLASYPGVARVAAVNGLPLNSGLNVGGQPAHGAATNQIVELRAITPGYFRTLGVPVLSGRDVTEADNAKAAPVVLVSETTARRWWPGKSPIGEQVSVGGKSEGLRTVVGVVADVHAHSLAEPQQIVVYEPFAQLSDGMMKIVNGWFPTTFAIRMSGDLDMAAPVQRAVSDADEEVPVARFASMQGVVDKTLAGPRFFSWLASGFAGFALLLTVIGLFGLLSYQVTQRTREIGVRLAVGADRGQILRLIMGRGLALAAIGLLIGSTASLAVPRLVGSVLADNIITGGGGIASILFSSTLSIITAAVAVMMAAALASYLPARRAAAVEPTEALRAE